MKIPDFDIINKIKSFGDSEHKWWIIGGLALAGFLVYMNASVKTISGQSQAPKKTLVSRKKQNKVQTGTVVSDHSSNVPKISATRNQPGNVSYDDGPMDQFQRDAQPSQGQSQELTQTR
jgi:hypothetical protein